MAKSDPKLLTQAEYARSRKARKLSGGSRESVRKAVDEERISVFGPDKLIDADLADAQWARNTRTRVSPQAQAGVDGGDLVDQAGAGQPDAPAAGAAAPVTAALPEGYTQARARREMAEAEEAEMRTARIRGTMVLRADVERAGYEIGRELRDAMEAAVNSLAPELAAIDTADAVAAVLRRHNRVLQEVLVRTAREKIGASPTGAS